MSKYVLREKAYGFSVELVKLLNNLSVARITNPLFGQLIRSGTSIGANIEEADSSPTRKDFKHKMFLAKKEAAETIYWLRIVIDAEILNNQNNVSKVKQLLDECTQILKIIAAIVRKV